VALPVLLAMLAAGCGSGTGTGAAGDAGTTPGEPASTAPATPRSPSPPPDEPDLPTITPPTGPPTTPTDTFQRIAVAGTLRAAGGGCLLLVTDQNSRYALHGSLVDRLHPGTTVKVRGRATGSGYDDACAAIAFRVTEILGS
jgi:hypothetical protein